MPPIVIYAPKTSNRLNYVLDYVFGERLKTGYRLVHDTSDAGNSFFISYGSAAQGRLSIPDSGLLWETGIKEQKIITGTWNNIPTLFHEGDSAGVPFDIFSAIFFLLSRYEEYYSYQGDKHGRYPATESVLYKNGWLQRPVVDEWITQLGKILAEQYGIQMEENKFSYLPTYDIDIAYSYKLKGFTRTAGAALKNIVSGKLSTVNERLRVLGNRAPDPYDSYALLHELHTSLKYQPIYFILAAMQTSLFDKNISPMNMGMQILINKLGEEGTIGMHPSYYSDMYRQKFDEEKNVLEKLTGTAINKSRQHYIKLNLPETYRNLVAHHITDDYSMGYATQLGFRAGTGSSFLWYDVENEMSTELRIHPFCFMDTTAHFDRSLKVNDAFEQLEHMAERLKSCNSRLITVFHNFSLGSDKEWNGWATAYSSFLKKYSTV